MDKMVKLSLADEFQAHLEKGKALRLGRFALASLKVHEYQGAGRVSVISGADAGKCYLGRREPGEIIHLDVLHLPQRLDPFSLAGEIWPGLVHMLERELSDLGLSLEDTAGLIAGLGSSIMISTALGRGSLPQLFGFEAPPCEGPPREQVQILLPTGLSRCLPPLVSLVEAAVRKQGGTLREIDRVEYRRFLPGTTKMPGMLFPASVPVPMANYNYQGILLRLAAKLGSVTEAEGLLLALGRPSSLSLKLNQLVRRHGVLDEELAELAAHGMIQKGLLGVRLTGKGREMLQHLKLYRSELEAELRKLIRRLPPVTSLSSRGKQPSQKARSNRVLARNKVISLPPRDWPGEIAIPETVISAIKRSVFEQEPNWRLERRDLHVYSKKKVGSSSICLVIDGSGSMIGEKIRAVRYLAEHLLLSSREKVAVVVFQEMQANVVVPFTRNFRKLQASLAAIEPGGLTPLAKGIVKGLELIAGSSVRSPLMLLITDGLPTFPHWTYDAQKDALRAGGLLASARVKFACIGVQPNRDFLTELAREAKGKLYIVDNIDRHSLVAVAAQERRSFQSVERGG